MHKKIIQFKPGVITLFDKNTDPYFGGSLLMNPQIFKKEAEIKENTQQNFKKSLKQLTAKKPSVSLPSIGFNTFYQELIDITKLIDFSELFHFLLKLLTQGSNRIWDSIKSLTERLFYSPGPSPKREFNIHIEPPKVVFKSLAIACLIIAFLSLSSILLPLSIAQINSMNEKARAEQQQKIEQKLAEERQAQIRAFEIDPNQQLIPKQFKLFIPKIGLESAISPSVNLDSEEDYKKELLTTGVAHAKGSYFPGQKGSVFLFAHSTDTIAHIAQFNAKFFSLGELDSGDEIEILYGTKNYKYKVTSKTIITPDQVDTIKNSNNSLILMTCTPPGTDWNRLIIFAEEQLN